MNDDDALDAVHELIASVDYVYTKVPTGFLLDFSEELVEASNQLLMIARYSMEEAHD